MAPDEVAEVVSPESEERDREDKPIMYAAMGIPTFWLIERLTTRVPYPMDFPLVVPTR